MRTLRIATWNVLHGLALPAGRVDLDAVAEHLRRLAADVVALQEVDRELPRSGGTDQTRELAAALGLHGAFGPALSGNPDHRWRDVGPRDDGGPAYGVALLSRWPLEEVERTTLPGGGPGRRERSDPSPGWDHEPRAALTAVVRTPDGPLRVTATHLSYLPWRGVAQLRRAARAAAAMRDDGRPALPAVLAGDLNLPARLVRALLPAWDHGRAAATYPLPEPRFQVDQIAVQGPIRLVDARTGPVGPSDHLRVVATVQVAGA